MFLNVDHLYPGTSQMTRERQTRPPDSLLWVSWTLTRVKGCIKPSQTNCPCIQVSSTLNQSHGDSQRRVRHFPVCVFVYSIYQFLEYPLNVCCHIENEFIIILIIYVLWPGQCLQKRPYSKAEDTILQFHNWATQSYNRQVQYSMNRPIPLQDRYPWKDGFDNCLCTIYVWWLLYAKSINVLNSCCKIALATTIPEFDASPESPWLICQTHGNSLARVMVALLPESWWFLYQSHSDKLFRVMVTLPAETWWLFLQRHGDSPASHFRHRALTLYHESAGLWFRYEWAPETHAD